MKKQFTPLMLLLFLIVPIVTNGQMNDRPLVYETMTTEKQINLLNRLERSSTAILPEINLFQVGDRLNASILSYDKDIFVQITDENRNVVYEETIKTFQVEWTHGIDNLQMQKLYTIKFIVPSMGYLIGHFYK